MPDKLLAEWFWTDRWMGSSGFLLPLEPRGLYREMLTQAWRRGGTLPNNPEAIRRATAATVEEWARCWPHIQRFWLTSECGTYLYNVTQQEVIADCMARKQVAIDRARKAANARWEKEKEGCSSNAKAMLKQCPPSPSLSKSPSKEPKDKQPCADKPARGGYSAGFEAWWKAYRHREARGSKAKAFTYWKRDKLDGTVDELLAMLPRFEATKDWQRGCQPMAQTFLCGKQWECPPQPERDNGGHHCKGKDCKRLLQEDMSLETGLCRDCREHGEVGA